MTSKEALEKLINKTGIINDTCAHLLACVRCGKCKFEEPIETCADYQLVMTIEKDLEILEQLEILKKYYSPFKKFLEEMFEKGYNKDLTKVKEWLGND